MGNTRRQPCLTWKTCAFGFAAAVLVVTLISCTLNSTELRRRLAVPVADIVANDGAAVSSDSVHEDSASEANDGSVHEAFEPTSSNVNGIVDIALNGKEYSPFFETVENRKGVIRELEVPFLRALNLLLREINELPDEVF